VWVTLTLQQAELDMNPPGGAPWPKREWTSREALLASFDTNVASARAVLSAASDVELQAPWTMKNGGHTLFTMPKAGVLRTFVFNHSVHHRGQLSVYLRLCDVQVPPMIGPTADAPF